jgi:VanZ family protein
VIFSASADSSSFEHSSRLLGPLIHWLLPRISEQNLRQIVFIMRKVAHMTEYAILLLLLWRAFKNGLTHSSRPGRSAWWAWLLCLAYACTDEFHQSFVPTRQASVWDVCIDAAGALIAMGAVKSIMVLRDRRLPKK